MPADLPPSTLPDKRRLGLGFVSMQIETNPPTQQH
jgi:hypothetical protein